MKKLLNIKSPLSLLMCLVLVLGITGCTGHATPKDAPIPSDYTYTPPPAPSSASGADAIGTESPGTSPDVTPVESDPPEGGSSAPPYTHPEPEGPLVEYNGVVEHLFFHSAIAYPELAFDGDSREKGYDDYMVTVSEYNKMLLSMYNKGFILVNMNDVWSEYTNDQGVVRMKKNTLMLPQGKKPLILSFDDVSYYQYMSSDGFAQKLILGEDGELWDYGVDPSGKEVISQSMDVITILDQFVRDHPDFSLGGVKGCIALTGYEGILGYRTQTDKDDPSAAFEANRQKEIEMAKPIVARLKETGWYFASHSWGHIGLANNSFANVKADADRWAAEVGSLVGETKLFIYPYGSRLDGDDVNKTGEAFKYYHSLGFRVFASVGIESYSKIKSDISAVICDRMHADGVSLRNSRERYSIFYDAPDVFDHSRPNYGTKW